MYDRQEHRVSGKIQVENITDDMTYRKRDRGLFSSRPVLCTVSIIAHLRKNLNVGDRMIRSGQRRRGKGMNLRCPGTEKQDGDQIIFESRIIRFFDGFCL